MKPESQIEQKARQLEGFLISPSRRMPQYQVQAIAARIEALRWVLGDRDDDPILSEGGADAPKV